MIYYFFFFVYLDFIHSGFLHFSTFFTFFYILLHSSTFFFISLHSSTFFYILLHSSTFFYILLHSSTTLSLCFYLFCLSTFLKQHCQFSYIYSDYLHSYSNIVDLLLSILAIYILKATLLICLYLF